MFCQREIEGSCSKTQPWESITVGPRGSSYGARFCARLHRRFPWLRNDRCGLSKFILLQWEGRQNVEDENTRLFFLNVNVKKLVNLFGELAQKNMWYRIKTCDLLPSVHFMNHFVLRCPLCSNKYSNIMPLCKLLNVFCDMPEVYNKENGLWVLWSHLKGNYDLWQMKHTLRLALIWMRQFSA